MLGNSLGALVAAVAVALGVGYIVAESVVVFTVVKIVGAAYLIYLGIQAIRHRKAHAASAVDAAPSAPSVLTLLVQGFIVGVSNPKTVVFFIAVLPQFVAYEAGGIPLQLLTLGALFVAVALVTDSAWALLAGVARGWFGRLAAAHRDARCDRWRDDDRAGRREPAGRARQGADPERSLHVD